MRRRSRDNRERVEATRKGEKTRARTEAREKEVVSRVSQWLPMIVRYCGVKYYARFVKTGGVKLFSHVNSAGNLPLINTSSLPSEYVELHF